MGIIILIINLFFVICYFLLVVRAILPWIPHERTNFWVDLVYRLTNPFLNVIRLGFPPQKMGIDVSPFVGIMLLWLIQQAIIYGLRR